MTFLLPAFAPATPSGGTPSDPDDAPNEDTPDEELSKEGRPNRESGFRAPVSLPDDLRDEPVPLYSERPKTAAEWAQLWRALCHPLSNQEADYVNLRRSAEDVEFDLNPDKVVGGTAHLILKLPSLFRRLDEVCSTQGWSLTMEPSAGGLTAVHLNIWGVRRTGLSRASEPYQILQESATRAAGLFGIPTRLLAWRPVVVEYTHLAQGQRPGLDRVLEEHGVLQDLGFPRDENRRL